MCLPVFTELCAVLNLGSCAQFIVWRIGVSNMPENFRKFRRRKMQTNMIVLIVCDHETTREQALGKCSGRQFSKDTCYAWLE